MFVFCRDNIVVVLGAIVLGAIVLGAIVLGAIVILDTFIPVCALLVVLVALVVLVVLDVLVVLVVLLVVEFFDIGCLTILLGFILRQWW